jgi:hypothetical protein
LALIPRRPASAGLFATALQFRDDRTFDAMRISVAPMLDFLERQAREFAELA